MRIMRRIRNRVEKIKLARIQSAPLPILVHKQALRMRRDVGDIDLQLQENKAHNLALAAPKLDGICIQPGEVFSFWHLVGNCTRRRGYKDGVLISSGRVKTVIGGGMCHITNLLHWLVLHSPLTVCEHHHHNMIELFPECDAQLPPGCATAIVYNYLDYRVANHTQSTFQFNVYTDETHLHAELRTATPQPFRYQVTEEDAHFIKIDGVFYRKNNLVRRTIDNQTHTETNHEIITRTHSKVLYDEKFIQGSMIWNHTE